MATVVLLTSSNNNSSFMRSIGAYQLAHWLRKNDVDTEVVDFVEHYHPNRLVEIVSRFVNEQTKVIGLSTTFLSTEVGKIGSRKNGSIGPSTASVDLPRAPGMAANLADGLTQLKTLFPHVQFVAGGAQSFIAKAPLFNCVIDGFAEDSFLAYVRYVSGKNPFFTYEVIDGVIKPTNVQPKFEISASDFRWRSTDVMFPDEALPLELSRGCVFKCKFCAYPLLGKKKLDHLRSAEEITAELISNYEQFGITNYFACDDTLNDSVEKLTRLHSAIVKLPFRIKLVAFVRVDLLKAHPQTIQMLEDMGVISMFFGVETFNKQAASAIGKGFSGPALQDFLLELKSRLQPRINFHVAMITGLPGDTEESCVEGQEFLKLLEPGSWRFNPLTIRDPSSLRKGEFTSEFQKEYAKYGFVWPHKNPLFWERSDYTYKQALALADKLNTEGERYDKPAAWNLLGYLGYGITPGNRFSSEMPNLTPLAHARIKEYFKRKR